MTTTTRATMPLYDTRRGVQKMYTEGVVLADIQRQKQAGMSLREIAAQYEGVTHADISRVLKGEFPRSACKRKALKLPPLDLAPVCPIHGVVHVRATCPGATPPRRRWARVLGHEGWRME